MDISKIKVGSTSYDVKDAVARYAIDNLGPEVVTADRVKAALGVTEDGERFLKEDGTWQQINDPYAIIRVNLQEFLNNALANGDGLLGIVVSVQNTTDNTPAVTKTYAGDTLVFDGLIPVKAYRVSVESRTGYKLDYAYQDIATIDVGGDVTKTFKYEAYSFTVEASSSEDVPGILDSAVDRSSSGVYLIAIYSYGVETVTSGQLHHGDVLKVPIDVDTSTIAISESSDVNSYRKTESVDIANNKLIISYNYQQSITGYIILDQTSSDPTQKVIDESGKTYAQGYTTPQVISTIRTMSHCYVQQSYSSGTITIKQLDDTDGTKYADGTSAASDITSKNVFMRLPVFYTKQSTYATDKIKIEFWIDPLQSSAPSESGWKQWGGNDLIGKYEAKCTDTTNNTSGTLQSISGVESTGNVSQANFKTKARNGGTGFTLVKWRHQNIMAILFYAYYGHTNCQLLIGSGASSSNKNTGLKNSLGMTDTTSANGNTDNIVFWGLENWWDNKNEWMDNVVVNFPNYIITEDDNTTRTITTTGTTTQAWVYPTKFILGDNLDTLAVPSSTGGSDSTGYCDGQYFKTTSSCVVYRSGNYANAYGGVAYVYAYYDSSAVASNRGSRLAFTGTIEIV